MNYNIPPLSIDPATLPPPLLTSEPGSFARNTLAVRIPGIIRDTLERNDFPDDVRRSVEALRLEILDGVAHPLREDAPDREFWNTLSSDHLGHAWLDVPWYWAETFFYRRMLEATRYFQPGPTRGLDPYLRTKEGELGPDGAPRKVAELLARLPSERQERFQALLHASLWGNRFDLSYDAFVQMGRQVGQGDERANLLVDDAPGVWQFLTSAARREVIVIEDNAGTEQAVDLALVDFLLGEQLARRVTLHLKPQPFFVSDAMPGDFEAALAALRGGEPATRALAERLAGYLEEERLALDTHWFYPTALFYFQLPADLSAALGQSDLVILKGDANYRRLLGDAHWDPTTRFEYVTRYFPAPLAALRTLKAEEIVGLAPGQAEAQAEADPEWLVDGRRGVVQARF